MLNRSEKIATLDGWRAIAIAALLVCHWGSCLFRPGASTSIFPNAFAYLITRHAVMGVSLFFSLSGFLITLGFVSSREKITTTHIKIFYLRRAFRLLPVILVYLSAVAILSTLGFIEVRQIEIVSALFFFRNYLHPLNWYTGQFWSLSVEEHFYLFWPLSLYFAYPKRQLTQWVMLACVLVGLWRLVEAFHSLGYRLTGVPTIYLRTDTRLDFLLWGAFWALVVSNPQWKEKFKSVMTPLVWGIIFPICVFSPFLSLAWSFQFQAIFLPILFVGTALQPQWGLSRLLERSTLKYLGKLSFSLYLWQQLFMLSEAPGTKLLFPLSFYRSGWAPLAASIAASYVSYSLIERPALKIRDRFFPTGFNLTRTGQPQKRTA